MVLAEAAAAGLPIVAADSGAIAEVLRGAGTLFPAGDWLALARALGEVLAAPPERRRPAALVTAYSIEAAAERYAAAYEGAGAELAVDVLVRLRGALPGELGCARAIPRALHVPGSASTSATAAAISSGSSGAKYRAASPHTSGSDAATEQATGQPQAIASSGGSPKPS